jgi:Uncharacterized protein conserved in bacteria (DUF2066)
VRRPSAGAEYARAAIAGAIAWVLLGGAAVAAEAVYTIGNYPVEARAKDVVTAKNQALADGQQRAFRSLLKRLVPVTSFAQLKKLKTVSAANLVDGYQVRSERNSSTEYIASLDFKFQSQTVRDLLDREGIPYTDEQAQPVIVVPVWLAAANSKFGGDEKSWTDAWKGLDLKFSLTPVTLEPLKKEVTADVVKGMMRDGQGQRIVTGEYKSERVVLAVAEPDPQTKRLNVTLTGVDAVGGMLLKRAYRVDPSDAGYTVDVAAVVAHGILEGRWKAIKASGGRGGGGFSAGAGGGRTGGASSNLEIAVEFRGMGEWREISRRLAETPGVEDVDVLGLSGRGARVTVKYPDGPERLAEILASEGLHLKRAGAGWLLTAQ